MEDAKRIPLRNRKTERNVNIVKMRNAGSTYKAIAAHYGISIIRVRQILEVYGEKTG